LIFGYGKGCMAKKKQNSPEDKWEEELLGAFYDYRWHEVLDPLYNKMQLWKADQLDHEIILGDIERVQKELKEANQLLRFNRKFVLSIVMATEDFFKPWIAGHPVPPGVVIPE